MFVMKLNYASSWIMLTEDSKSPYNKSKNPFVSICNFIFVFFFIRRIRSLVETILNDGKFLFSLSKLSLSRLPYTLQTGLHMHKQQGRLQQWIKLIIYLLSLLFVCVYLVQWNPSRVFQVMIRPYKVKFAILRLTSLQNTKPTGMREGHKIETINFFK